MGLCEPHSDQQNQVQGPVPGFGQSQAQIVSTEFSQLTAEFSFPNQFARLCLKHALKQYGWLKQYG